MTSITPMTAADIDTVLRLWRATEGLVMRDVDSPEALTRYLNRNPGLSFVARQQEQIVGAVLCGHDGRRGYLQHLAVAASHRRQGVGRTLVERCLAALRAAGIGKCHLFVLKDHLPARSFWLQAGWSEREDVTLMSLTLCDSANA